MRGLESQQGNAPNAERRDFGGSCNGKFGKWENHGGDYTTNGDSSAKGTGYLILGRE
jgi:hypothetical protein